MPPLLTGYSCTTRELHVEGQQEVEGATPSALGSHLQQHMQHAQKSSSRAMKRGAKSLQFLQRLLELFCSGGSYSTLTDISVTLQNVPNPRLELMQILLIFDRLPEHSTPLRCGAGQRLGLRHRLLQPPSLHLKLCLFACHACPRSVHHMEVGWVCGVDD